MDKNTNFKVDSAFYDEVRLAAIDPASRALVLAAVLKTLTEAYAAGSGVPLVVAIEQVRRESDNQFVLELARRLLPKGLYWLPNPSRRKGKPISTWDDIATELDLPRSTLYSRWNTKVRETPGWPRIR